MRTLVIRRAVLAFAAVALVFAGVAALIVAGPPFVHSLSELGATGAVLVFAVVPGVAAGSLGAALAQHGWRVRVAAVLLALWQVGFWLHAEAPALEHPIAYALLQSKPGVAAMFLASIAACVYGAVALLTDLDKVSPRSTGGSEDGLGSR